MCLIKKKRSDIVYAVCLWCLQGSGVDLYQVILDTNVLFLLNFFLQMHMFFVSPLQVRIGNQGRSQKCVREMADYNSVKSGILVAVHLEEKEGRPFIGRWRMENALSFSG